MSDNPFYAKAFGGDFPVCTQEQATALETAYKRSVDWRVSQAGVQYDSRQQECACTLITRLLDGTASQGDMIEAGISIAKNIYVQKMTIIALAEAAERAMLQTEPVMGVSPKKEWVN